MSLFLELLFLFMFINIEEIKCFIINKTSNKTEILHI